jgi:hypothetical protein
MEKVGLHFGSSSSLSSFLLQLLFLDVWGPTALLSIDNKRYYLSIVDDFSKYTWCFPLFNKLDVSKSFLQFKLIVEKHFGFQIWSVQSDNEGEFQPLKTVFHSMSISYRLSCPHTHHQNGTVERKHRHLVETGLAFLPHALVPLNFWDEAFESSCYLINRLPSKVTSHKSPYEILFKSSPDYAFLKVYGYEYWPFLHPYNSNKLAFKSKSCIFIGYSKQHTGYKCLHLSSGRVYIARHVIFNEKSFPFTQVSSTPPSSSTHSALFVSSDQYQS